MMNSPRASTKGDSPTSPTAPPELKANPMNGTTNSIKNENNSENVNPDESFTQSGKMVSESGPSELKQSTVKKNKTKRRKQMYCLCEGEDDGTPMIRCEGPCKKWYHFRCVSLSEAEAEEISLYICPPCHKKTGLFTVKDWEGSEALEEVPIEAAWPGETNDSQSPPRAQLKKPKEVFKEEEIVSSEEKDDESEDEYIAESSKKRISKRKRSARRVTVSTGSSDSDVSDTMSKSSTARHSASAKGPVKTGTSASTNKRKGSTAKPPPAKKTKTMEGATTAQGDPVRKYCLGKLQEVICAIFLEFASVKAENAESTAENQKAPSEKKDLLTEEESKATTNKAASYVAELEDNLYLKYSEPDKDGKPSAGGRYKEHFRMLTFNLGKSDRVSLRKGIASGRISPAQLSVMSSTDLASEHLKHEIELAEKEALEHSILQKITAPRTKITHKGLESIEDINGNIQQPDRQRGEEQEQRMERERLARVRSMSMSRDRASPMLSESPTTISASWGQPLHSPLTTLSRGIEPSNALSPTITGATHPTFSPSSEIMAPPDTALALTDLINIDDDSPQDANGSLKFAGLNELTSSKQTISKLDLPTETITPSGPSPFALSQPSMPEVNPTTEDGAVPEEKNKVETESENQNSATMENMNDDAMDMDIEGEQSEDPDFDMFLDPDKDKEQDSSAVAKLAKPLTLEALPRIWSGAIVMPLESLIPLAPSVVATQIGGRIVDDEPQLWKQLFPTAEVRIDGRVPVDKSSQYLLTNRLNFSKELIAVCFSTQTASDPSSYNELIDYLISKGRHALVFPWGTHPSPSAPGRELYLVPLLREQPIPEFVEMLDNLRLPVKRDTNLLLGVFVLNKGKLSLPPTTSNLLQKTGNISSSIIGPNSTSLSVNAALPPNINPSTLAAEVASLTPDQIALMLRHLGQNISTTQPALPASTSIPNVPVPFSNSAPQQLYPFSQQPPQSPLTGAYPPQPYVGGNLNEPYGRNELDRDARGSYGGRGERGRGHHRGRGRSHGRDNDRSRFRNSETRVPDSGWSGRGRGGPLRGSPKG